MTARLVQGCNEYSALAMELLQPCTKSSSYKRDASIEYCVKIITLRI